MPPQDQDVLSSHEMTRSRAVIVLCALVLIVVVAIFGWWWYLDQNTTFATQTDFYNTLTEQNASFATAEGLALQSNFTAAIPLYQEALQNTSNINERIKVQLHLAGAMLQLGDYEQALPLLLEILTMSTDPLTARARATAAENIADIYVRGDKTIQEEIFKNGAYAPLLVAGNSALTARHLHEYAASFYPLATAIFRISLWYATQLPTEGASSRSSLSSDNIAQYVTTVKENIAIATQDIAYMQKDGTVPDDLRTAQLWRAIVVGNLNRFGDETQGDANELFKDVIDQSRAVSPGEDGVARYNYAIFLAQAYGAGKKTEIVSILAPLSDEDYAQSRVHAFLRSSRSSVLSKQYPLMLAALDPDFKKLLMSLGWTAADFSS